MIGDGTDDATAGGTVAGVVYVTEFGRLKRLLEKRVMTRGGIGEGEKRSRECWTYTIISVNPMPLIRVSPLCSMSISICPCSCSTNGPIILWFKDLAENILCGEFEYGLCHVPDLLVNICVPRCCPC